MTWSEATHKMSVICARPCVDPANGLPWGKSRPSGDARGARLGEELRQLLLRHATRADELADVLAREGDGLPSAVSPCGGTRAGKGRIEPKQNALNLVDALVD